MDANDYEENKEHCSKYGTDYEGVSFRKQVKQAMSLQGLIYERGDYLHALLHYLGGVRDCLPCRIQRFPNGQSSQLRKTFQGQISNEVPPVHQHENQDTIGDDFVEEPASETMLVIVSPCPKCFIHG